VDVRGADKVARMLTRPMVDAIEAGLAAVALEVQNELAPYPGQSGKAQGFKSDKSRRFFFAALRKGQITVPYRRSGDLGRAWSIRKVGSMRVALINTQSYAGLVHSVTNQADYHKGNWTTDKTAADRVRPRVKGIMEAAIKAALRG